MWWVVGGWDEAEGDNQTGGVDGAGWCWILDGAGYWMVVLDTGQCWMVPLACDTALEAALTLPSPRRHRCVHNPGAPSKSQILPLEDHTGRPVGEVMTSQQKVLTPQTQHSSL